MQTEFQGIYTRFGNEKVGRNVGIVNREAETTCPGSSPWCREHCYAKKRLSGWQQERYRTDTIRMPIKLPKIVRFQVSGDFDTPEYIQWAIDVVRNFPDTSFWAYTRSWRVPDLLPFLEQLRAESNIQLFASTDTTMDETPPSGWRIAYIQGDKRYTGTGMTCLAQVGKMPDCKSCTYCFRKRRGHVEFITH